MKSLKLITINHQLQARKDKYTFRYVSLDEKCNCFVSIQDVKTLGEFYVLTGVQPITTLHVSCATDTSEFKYFISNYVRHSIITKNIIGNKQILDDTVAVVYRLKVSPDKDYNKWGEMVASVHTTIRNALKLGFSGYPFITNSVLEERLK